MSFDGIVAGDYGQVMELTYIDIDTGIAADISTYSDTIRLIFTKAENGTPTNKTATFVTDGSDGKVQYTTESGFLTAGIWFVRGQVINTGTAVLSTAKVEFRVLD